MSKALTDEWLKKLQEIQAPVWPPSNVEPKNTRDEKAKFKKVSVNEWLLAQGGNVRLPDKQLSNASAQDAIESLIDQLNNKK